MGMTRTRKIIEEDPDSTFEILVFQLNFSWRNTYIREECTDREIMDFLHHILFL